MWVLSYYTPGNIVNPRVGTRYGLVMRYIYITTSHMWVKEYVNKIYIRHRKDILHR